MRRRCEEAARKPKILERLNRRTDCRQGRNADVLDKDFLRGSRIALHAVEDDARAHLFVSVNPNIIFSAGLFAPLHLAAASSGAGSILQRLGFNPQAVQSTGHAGTVVVYQTCFCLELDRHWLNWVERFHAGANAWQQEVLKRRRGGHLRISPAADVRPQCR